MSDTELSEEQKFVQVAMGAASEVIREQIILNGWRQQAALFAGAATQSAIAAQHLPAAMADFSTGEQIEEEKGLFADIGLAQLALAQYYKRRLEEV